MYWRATSIIKGAPIYCVVPRQNIDAMNEINAIHAINAITPIDKCVYLSKRVSLSIYIYIYIYIERETRFDK